MSSLDKYERVRVLGKGTFGRAWLVRDKQTRKEWVAKEIKCENKQDLEEALAEAEVLSKVAHFNIISYREVIRSSSKLVTIVMEYADDGDVADKIGRRKFRMQYLDEPQILRWAVQLAQALEYLHSRGILHRDIKTANLFLTSKGHLKLGDFGIARVLDRNAERASARTCKTPVGTPMYMSPEICAGKAYGQKADMWAFGCVLYEMASLRPAFMAQTMDGLVAKIKRGNHDRHMPKTYSPDLRRLISDLLSIDPQRRPSVGEVLAMPFLQPYLQDAPATLLASGRPAGPDPGHAKGAAPKAQSVPEIVVIKGGSPQAKRRGSEDNPWAISPAATPRSSRRGSRVAGSPHSSPNRPKRHTSDTSLMGYAARHGARVLAAENTNPGMRGSPRTSRRHRSEGDVFRQGSARRHDTHAAKELPAVELRGRPPASPFVDPHARAGAGAVDRRLGFQPPQQQMPQPPQQRGRPPNSGSVGNLLSPGNPPPNRSRSRSPAGRMPPSRGSADLGDLADYYSKHGIRTAAAAYSNRMAASPIVHRRASGDNRQLPKL